MNPLFIKGSQLTAGKTDVVINDRELANALVKDSKAVIAEFQKEFGTEFTVDDIELDHNGQIIISDPKLARLVKSNLSKFKNVADSNGICGARC